jgi:hypothetical protein
MEPTEPGRFLIGNPFGCDLVAEMAVILTIEFVAEGDLVEIGMGDRIETSSVDFVHLERRSQPHKQAFRKGAFRGSCGFPLW